MVYPIGTSFALSGTENSSGLGMKVFRIIRLVLLTFVGTCVFFFSIPQETAVTQSGDMSSLDMSFLRRLERGLLTDDISWCGRDHAGSAFLIESYMGRFRTGLSRADRRRVARLIVSESRRRGFNPFFIAGLIEVESSFYSRAVSPAGAVGLMQIRPFVGRMLAARLGVKWRGRRTLFNPFFNVRAGIYYLSMLRRRFGGDPALMLAAYNHGPTKVSRLLKRGRIPLEYARKVARASLRVRVLAVRRVVGRGRVGFGI